MKGFGGGDLCFVGIVLDLKGLDLGLLNLHLGVDK